MSQVYAQQAQAQAASLETSCVGSVHPNPQNTDSDSSEGKSRESYLQQGLEKPPSKIGRKHRVRCVNENGEEGDEDEEEDESDVSDEESGPAGENVPCKFFIKQFYFL